MSIKGIIGLVVGIVGFILLFGSYAVVSPGNRGVLVTLGTASEHELSEGIHLKWPVISRVHHISVRVQKSEAQAEAATKDMQRVGATIALNWHLNPEQVVQMFKSVGNENEIHERVISPAVSEVLKASAAKMTAEEILTKRLELKETIDTLLIKRLATYNVFVKDVSLVDFHFSKNFDEAVEAKQVQEQKAKQAEYIAQQATAEARARVNEARGQAEANLTLAKAQAESQRLLKQNLTTDILTLEYLKRWNGQLPQVLGGNGSNGPMFMLDLKQGQTQQK